MKSLAAVVLLSLLALIGCGEGKKAKPKPSQSIDELRTQLESILKDTHTPGVSVAIVHRDENEWVAALGKADVAGGRVATADTLFRIGSVSKAFASLSILKLVDQHKLSLDDTVHKLAPEVWFENRWEATDPIRVVHLLEHTTGWDDIHLREYAKDGASLSLRDAFDYDHHSRISRWRPGSRVSYCNAGPPVAAYIVEKLTGQRFEDYVQQNLFGPIGMTTATYFQPPPASTTILYHEDGTTPYPYWNIIFRPAGSINASAKDMAAYVRFYLNRGMANGTQVIPASDIDRMEIPASGWAAKEGLKAGYGLSNYWTVSDGFVYHGHNGGVNGGLTEMQYMPAYDTGYFYSINSANVDAFRQIGKAIRAYITRKLEKPPLPPAASLPPNSSEYAGWYEPDSPRNEMTRFLERLAGIAFVHFSDGKLLSISLGGWNDPSVPVSGSQFRDVSKDPKEAPEPIATLALLTNNDGRFLEAGTGMMKQIPAGLAILEILLTAFAVLAMLAILIYGPFWLLGGFSKKRRRPSERAIRIWPLIAVLSLIVCGFLLSLDDGDLITNFGHPSIWSVGFFLMTILFGVASVASAIALWRAPAATVRRGVRRFSTIVTTALLIATAYLAYWGVIGIRTWA